MNLAHFIAKRLTLSSSGKKTLPIVNIAIGGIVLGMCMMMLTIFIVSGYRQAIYTKILGFNGTITLVSYDSNSSYQTSPIPAKEASEIIDGVPHIIRAEPFGIIGGVATTDTETEAIVLKGVAKDYDWSFYEKCLVKGKLPQLNSEKTSNEILVSNILCKKLQLKVGDKLYTHFLQSPPRSRAFVITGIYDTDIQEIDKIFVLGDIRHVQKLYGWEDTQYTGISLQLNDFKNQSEVTQLLQARSTTFFDEEHPLIKVVSARKEYAYLFDWLDIMNLNVRIVLFLILLVSAFNMISALLVIILDKTRHIGVLKALGMNNRGLRKVFLYKAAYIIGKGMFWGNIIGMVIAALQYKFQWIKLDPKNYYLNAVPIKIDFGAWLLLNIGVLFLTLCVMIIPTVLITRIAPAKVIRID